MSIKAKSISIISAIVVVGLALFIFIKFCFVYSEGTNEGDINYFQREGFIFKTYEGKMIQSGFKGATTAIQSNEFKFSVEDEGVAATIDSLPNQQVKLYWKRYLGTLPWRGNSPFIVYKVTRSNAR